MGETDNEPDISLRYVIDRGLVLTRTYEKSNAQTMTRMRIMRWEQHVQYASISDIGFRRQNNQDSLSVQICNDQETWGSHGHLFLVADGMGGHAVGELASKIAVDTIPHTFFKTRDQDVTTALKKNKAA